jgi:hypothetical protein
LEIAVFNLRVFFGERAVMNMTENKTENGERKPELRWDNVLYWQSVAIGQCSYCFRKEKAITREGLCWICENDPQRETIR